ncbi:MAG: AMP-binding protein, partial [Gemmatimonadales bacterium]
MTSPKTGAPLWTPAPDRAAGSNLAAFIRYVRAARLPDADAIGDYASLYRWSVARREAFWPAVWGFCGVVADARGDREPWDAVGVGLDRMAPPDARAGPRWFPGARLNFAENLLRRQDDGPAVIAVREGGPRRILTWAGLHTDTARVAAALRDHGIQRGDRVAAYVPNIPEAIVAMLGAASLGAIWSTCSPEFGVAGVVDRFGQITPRVLLCVDGYRYAGKAIDLRSRAAEVVARVPAIERVVVIPYLDLQPDLSSIPLAARWDEWLGASAGATRFDRLPFDHPLYILYSSGTTGLPKCMVHGAGGTLLQHQKEHVLHVDLRPVDRLFYATTTGWMMW